MEKHLVIVTKPDKEMYELAKKHLGSHVVLVAEVEDLDLERFEEMIDNINEASKLYEI